MNKNKDINKWNVQGEQLLCIYMRMVGTVEWVGVEEEIDSLGWIQNWILY